MRSTCRRFLAASTLFLAPALLPAQGAANRTLDLTLGAGGGWSRWFDHRTGPGADILLAFRSREQPNSRVIIAGNAAVQGLFGLSSNCNRAPSEGCLGDFPLFYSAGVVAGWERGSVAGRTVRLLVGPALYRASDVRGERGITAGIQTRADAVAGTVGRVALVGSVRGALIPSFQAAPLGLWSFGLGVRLR